MNEQNNRPGLGKISLLSMFVFLTCFYSLTTRRTDWLTHPDGKWRFQMLRSVVGGGRQVPDDRKRFAIGANVAMLPLFLLGEAINRSQGISFADQDFEDPDTRSNHNQGLSTRETHDPGPRLNVAIVKRSEETNEGINNPSVDYAAEACFFFYPMVCSLICIFFFQLLQHFQVLLTRSLALTSVLALGTMLWPYSGETWNEPLVALCLLGAYSTVVRSKGNADVRSSVMAGIYVAMGILTRFEAIIVFAPIGIYMVFMCLANDSVSKATEIATFIATSALGICATVLWNYWYFGSILAHGYGKEGFTTPLIYGVYGLLLSSGKSFFLYNPVALPALFGWAKFIRSHRTEASVAIASILNCLLVYGLWWGWGGDTAWGPRFLVLIIPLSLLPLGWCRLSRKPLVFAGIIVMAVYVQIIGWAVPMEVDYVRLLHEDALDFGDSHGDRYLALHYYPDFSPLVNHAKLLEPSVLLKRLFLFSPLRLSLLIGAGVSFTILAVNVRQSNILDCKLLKYLKDRPGLPLQFRAIIQIVGVYLGISMYQLAISRVVIGTESAIIPLFGVLHTVSIDVLGLLAVLGSIIVLVLTRLSSRIARNATNAKGITLQRSMLVARLLLTFLIALCLSAILDSKGLPTPELIFSSDLLVRNSVFLLFTMILSSTLHIVFRELKRDKEIHRSRSGRSIAVIASQISGLVVKCSIILNLVSMNNNVNVGTNALVGGCLLVFLCLVWQGSALCTGRPSVLRDAHV